MKPHSQIGPMVLLEVHQVIKKYQPGNSIVWYSVLFDKCKLAVTGLHSFVVIRDGKEIYLPTNLLQSKDLLWIDVGAFSADGSFYPERSE